jgi:lysozyme family protein
MPDYRDAITKVLQHEGGYVNNPKDRGKRTNYGVTQAVYEQFIGRKLIGSDTDAPKGQPMEEAESVMRNMPIGNAIAVYKQLYWDKIQGDKIRKYSIAAAIFDQSINRGNVAAVKQAQRVLKNVFNYPLAEDGVVGSATITALNTVDEAKFLNSYLQESILAYNKIVQNNPTQSVFLNGWLKRVESLRSYVSQNIGKINATTVGIGVGVVLALGVGSYFLYKYISKNNAVASRSSSVSGRAAPQAA